MKIRVLRRKIIKDDAPLNIINIERRFKKNE